MAQGRALPGAGYDGGKRQNASPVPVRSVALVDDHTHR